MKNIEKKQRVGAYLLKSNIFVPMHVLKIKIIRFYFESIADQILISNQESLFPFFACHIIDNQFFY